MYIHYAWVRDYLPDAPSREEAARVLNLTGLETELDGEGLEIEHTVNRPDAMSHYGVARELAVKLDLELREPPVFEGEIPVSTDWTIESEDAEQCPRYTGLEIDGVHDEPSPPWLKEKLAAIGQTSHGFLVDLTNYLLWEFGHPCHAFDADLLTGQRIVVRMGRPGERLTTLDGQDHDANGLLCIADAEKPVAFGGVMGGENSEVGPKTTRLLFELAVFKPSTVRRSGRRENINSDARHRFERGVDRERLDRVIRRFIYLVLEQLPEARVVGLRDMDLAPFTRANVFLQRKHLDRLLGISLDDAVVEGLLVRMGCQIEKQGADWAVSVPGYKVDVTREADVIEEIIRFAGLDLLQTDLPEMAGTDIEHDPVREATTTIRHVLQGMGLQEAYTYSFGPETWDRAFGLSGEPTALRNPMNANQAVLRRYILPGLLSVVRTNINRGNTEIHFYELGHTFRAGEEPHHLAIVMTSGKERNVWWEVPTAHPFYAIKGVYETLAGHLGWHHALTLREEAPSFLVQGEALGIYAGDKLVGGFGTLAPEIAEKCDDLEIDPPPVVLELDLTHVASISTAVDASEVLSPFPGIKVDMAFVLDAEHSFAEVRDHLSGLGLDNLESLELFDVYSGKSIEKGKKSLGFRFRFRSPERTLTSEEVNASMTRVTESVEKAFGAVIRM